MVGLCDQHDCVDGVATKPRPDLLVAPEALLEEGLAALDIAAKCLGEPGGVVEIETNISILIEMLMSITLLSKRYSFQTSQFSDYRTITAYARSARDSIPYLTKYLISKVKPMPVN
ncbi:hypothetical protein [Halococcus salsus]|uniref:hypothetical protein n=1 Tax=Halococcus salsus TaxID=2162894 RepID=UPI001358A54E|nr:hypothetical protein [Halococcus salsus]